MCVRDIVCVRENVCVYGGKRVALKRGSCVRERDR